ncbi:MAG: hypothetical protein HY561_10210 [Gemmatimonadetes bacterium]|nr:hypothetical protein [Gemmatimonadota bacterium]
MRWSVAALAAGLVAGLPASGLGQRQSCDLLPGAKNLNRIATGDGRELIFISGPVRFACTGGVTLRSDSAVSISGSGELQFIGHVEYGDSLKTLTGAWLNYFGREGRLFARGDVVLTDRKTNSVIRGPELEYRRQDVAMGRPESITRVRGRPHAVLYPRNAAGAPPADTAARPFEVDSDSMEIHGQRYFRALGNAELRRGETHGSARMAEFDQTDERLVLTGGAQVHGEGFDLAGERITALLTGEQLREVTCEREAVLLAEELRLDAPQLRIFFKDGEMQRLVAVGATAPAPPVAGPGGPPVITPERRTRGSERVRSDSAAGARPVALAKDFRLVADSIEALAPGQALEQVVAVGEALGERLPDSLGARLPAAVARDWIRGDTIYGYFVPADSAAAGPVAEDSARVAAGERRPAARSPAPDGSAPPPGPPGESDVTSSVPPRPAADSGARRPRRELERIVAIGPEGRARSVYRLREEGDTASTPAVNYIIANRITLFLRAGEVLEMEAVGPIRGIHLQPTKPKNQPENSPAGGSPVATRSERA